jgi:TPR repeat protein
MPPINSMHCGFLISRCHALYRLPQDYAEAVKWYRRAAEQGGDMAQLKLGEMYSEARGWPEDLVQAHMWFNLAAAHSGFGANKRDALARRMTPEQIAEAERLAREWKPKQ